MQTFHKSIKTTKRSYNTEKSRKGVQTKMSFQAYTKYLFNHILAKSNGNTEEKKNKPNPLLFNNWFGLFPFSIKLMFRK